MTKERENVIKALEHEEPKQAHDGDRRRTVFKNASYSMESLGVFMDSYEGVL